MNDELRRQITVKRRVFGLVVIALVALLVTGVVLSPALASINAEPNAGDYLLFAKALATGVTADRKANEPSCDSSNEKQAEVSGSSSNLYGRIHSNADVGVSGTGNTFFDTSSPNNEITFGVHEPDTCQSQAELGNTYASGGPTNITGNGNPADINGPYQIGPGGWPGNLGTFLNADNQTFGTDITQVLGPGAVCDVGDLTLTTDYVITPADTGKVICRGTGKVILSLSGVSSANPLVMSITVVSHGPIEFGGQHLRLTPFKNGILAWTDLPFSTTATSIKLNGSNLDIPEKALLFTPRSGQDVSGSDDSDMCIQLIGQGALKIAGSNSSYGPFGPSCPLPLAVILNDFSVSCQADAPVITWETMSELQTQGFNLYRGVDASGPNTQLNATLIPAQGPGSAQGFMYTWTDDTAAPGSEYFYWLEDVVFAGATSMHGPISAICSAPTAVTLSDLNADNSVDAAFSGWMIALALGAMLASFVAVRRMRTN